MPCNKRKSNFSRLIALSDSYVGVDARPQKERTCELVLSLGLQRARGFELSSLHKSPRLGSRKIARVARKSEARDQGPKISNVLGYVSILTLTGVTSKLIHSPGTMFMVESR
jgi:hypothetical protein